MRYSQYEEDDIIREFFGEKVGKFLDLGAADGKGNSNTRALYERGWKGTCVEPNPYLFNELFKLYRLDLEMRLFHVAMSGDGRDLLFHHSDQLSTACAEIAALENMREFFRGTYWIGSMCPDRILELAPAAYDFVSLDCEAMDFEIAQASQRLFEPVQLICFEHALPGTPLDDVYVKKFTDLLGSFGFGRIVGRTKGNTLVAR